MSKKILSIILTISLCIGICGSITSCSKKDGDLLVFGDWLGMINQSFGMQSYAEKTPYFKNINSQNKYFSTIQIACEWDVINKTTSIDVNEKVRYKTVLITLVNACAFLDVSKSDEEKIKYAQDNFPKSIKGKTYGLERYINYQDANELLTEAQDKWAHPHYEEVEKYEPLDGVVDITNNPDVVGKYTINTDGSVFIPTVNNKLISVGNTYILPASGSERFAKVYKAASVDATDAGLIIKNYSDELKFEDVVKELHIQNSFTPDFTNLPVTDGTGKILKWEDDVSVDPVSYSNTKPVIMPLKYNPSDKYDVQQTAITSDSKSLSLDFTFDGVKIKGKVSGDKVQFSAEVGIGDYVTVSKSYEISDFSVDGNVNYSFNPFDFGLKSARASYTYSTKESLSIKASYGSKNLSPKNKLSDNKLAEEYIKEYLSILAKASKGGYSSKSIKIVSIPTPLTIGGVAGVNIEIRLGFTIEGKIEISVNTKTTQGLEYKKGNGFRAINQKSVDEDISFEAKAEIYIYVGVVVQAFDFNIIDVGAELGIGGNFSAVVHLLDYSDSDPLPYLIGDFGSSSPMLGNEKILIEAFAADSAILKPTVCFDVKVYFIFRITLGNNSLLGKLFSASFDICGKDNGPYLYTAHFENGVNVGEKCKLKFRTEKDNPSSKTASSNGNTYRENFTINIYYYEFEIGENKTIMVTQYPKEYKASDITWTSENSNIATVDSTGKVTAKAEGNTTIIVKSSDGKYSQKCSIVINPDNVSKPNIGDLPGAKGGGGW